MATMLGKPYDRAIFNFLEAVTFKLLGQGHKGTSSWKTGLWVGKCTESDEHILLTSEGAFKARSIRRRPLQEQVDRELAQVVTGLPWSAKDNSKDQDKGSFVFPAGQLLRTVTGQDEGLKTDKAEEEQELQDPNAQAEPMTAQEAEEIETNKPSKLNNASKRTSKKPQIITVSVDNATIMFDQDEPPEQQPA